METSELAKLSYQEREEIINPTPIKKTVRELKRLVSIGKLNSVEDALDLLKNVFGLNDSDARYYYGRF